MGCRILYLKVIDVNGMGDESDDSDNDDLDTIYFPIDNGGYCDSLQAYLDYHGAWFPKLYNQSIKKRERDDRVEKVGR